MTTKLTRDMGDALHLMRRGLSPFCGVHGRSRLGRGGTMAGLVRRGLVARSGGGYRLTDSGRGVSLS